MDSATSHIQVRDLGRMAYAAALAEQRAVHAKVLADKQGPTLLLVEHDPVITVTRRPGAEKNLLLDRARLREMGLDVQPTDRGGDVTYHGPGQLVVYPIIRLAEWNLNVGRYMRMLEEIVIDAMKAFAVEAHRVAGCTGVWVEVQATQAKICAMGIRVKRNVSLHGLALNVDPNLLHFQSIVPCGLANRKVTSMRELLEDRCPSLQLVKHEIVRQFDARLIRNQFNRINSSTTR